jgi:Sulfotransferase family
MPNFFVVGAARGGTTGLYQLLEQHPQVFLSRIKEPNYFGDDIDSTAYLRELAHPVPDIGKFLAGSGPRTLHFAHVQNWEHYQLLFRDAGEARAIGECSTSYLISANAARNIRAAVPAARIIIVLRDPVQRAFSHHGMLVAQGRLPGSFLDAVKRELANPPPAWGIVRCSQYCGQVRRYLETFGEGQVAVFLTEDFADGMAVRERLASFLGIEAGLMPTQRRPVNAGTWPRFGLVNVLARRSGVKSLLSSLPEYIKRRGKRWYYAPRHAPKLRDDDRVFLEELFRTEIEGLASILGRDLSHWLGKHAESADLRSGSGRGVGCAG